MTTAVTGSIATDHLLRFPGRFTDSLGGDLSRLSLSFLADHLEVRRGGCAANIAYGMGLLGARPHLVAAAGLDFTADGYADHLTAAGVDVTGVLIDTDRHTGRFVCTTDIAGSQLATFYPGAMGAAASIVLGGLGPDDLVLVGPNDPAAMLNHTRDAHLLGAKLAADPGQQLAYGDGPFLRELVEDATVLFTNEYEAELLQTKTGWTTAQVLERVGLWVTTLGEQGALLRAAYRTDRHVQAVPVDACDDPTGAGDAFRAGFLTGWQSWGLTVEAAAQLGATVAAACVQTVGPQDYRLNPGVLADQAADTYGRAMGALVATFLPAVPA